MNRDAVDDAWSAAEWHAALALVWHHGWSASDGDEEEFLAALFTLLRELHGRTTKVRRREVNERLLALIGQHPEFDMALEVSLMFHKFVEDARTDDAGDVLSHADYGTELPLDVPGGLPPVIERPRGPAPRKVNRFLTVPIWYMTDRTPTGDDDPAKAYSTTGSQTLHTGKASVTIPDLHRKGRLELPPKIFTFELRPDPAKHFALAAVEPLDGETWLGDLSSAVKAGDAEDTSRDVLVFIHGYRTTWKQSLLRAAQLARDVEFRGPTVAYAWASKGRALAYDKDAAAAVDTVPVLREALTLLLRRSGAKRVHVVAHSMGNRAIIGALEGLAHTPMPKDSAELRELVFAAPDVNLGTFVDFVERYFSTFQTAFNRKTQVPSRLTLYVCADDYALGLSKWVNEIGRAGDPRHGRIVRPPLDTVDTTPAIVSKDTHGYFVSNRDVLTDLFGAVRGHPVQERPNLDPTNSDQGVYWTMRA